MNFDRSIRKTHWSGPMGPMVIAATERGIAGIWFEGQRHMPRHAAWVHAADDPLLAQATVQLADYFDGRRTSFDLPLDLEAGTPFQQSVWRALLAIPRGATTNYGALGRGLGAASAARAIGAAVGRNPVSIVVPCHRVIGSTGALTGYAGGLDRKTALLKLEGAL
jgi:methylated-DNA-[protein]-cysteine S-methyltransferase